MKARLKYNLDNLDDRMAHLRAVKSLELCMTLYGFDQHLRSEIKYSDKDYQDLRDELYNIMDTHGINLDELIQ